VHLVVLIETLQETLVDGIQVNDEEIVQRSIISRHDGTVGIHVFISQ